MTEEPKIHGKLVRDRIPEIISAAGATPTYHRLGDGEYVRALIMKLCEEAEELRLAEPKDRLGELADVWEVLTSLLDALGLSERQVRDAADRKRAERGGFSERLWLDEVTPPP